MFRFFTASVFRDTVTTGFPTLGGNQLRRDVEQFMLAFDTDVAPVVGQQVTLTNTNSGAVGPRITLLEQRAGTQFVSKSLGGSTTECDLVAKFVQGGAQKSFIFNPAAGNFVAGDGTTTLSDSALRAIAATSGQEVTFTAVPPGSGIRIAFGQ